MDDQITQYAYVTAPNARASSNLSDDPRRPKVRDDYFLVWNGLETWNGVSLSLQPGERRLLPLFLAERYLTRYPNAEFQVEVTTDKIELRPMVSGVPCPFCGASFPDRQSVRDHAMACEEGPMAPTPGKGSAEGGE